MTQADFAERVSGKLPHHEPENRGRYSLARAIRRLANTLNSQLDGLEGEVSQEIARRVGRRPEGFFVPWDVQVRSLTSSTGAGAVPTILSATLIDILRSKLVCASLGAMTLPDLTGGKFAIPKKTGTVSLGWLPEGGSPDPGSNPTIGQQVKFNPHTVGAYVDIPRLAIDQIPNADALIANDLTASVAVDIDRVALNGSGANNEPLGLLQTAGVPEVQIATNGGPPTRAVVVALEQTVGNNNADMGSLAYCTTPNGREALKNTEKVTGSGRYLWDDDDRPNGYRGAATKNLPSNLTKGSGTNLSPLIFGNWNDLVIGLWGPLDVLVNPYLFSTSGFIRISGLQDVDTQLRHAESFAIAPDMATS